MNPIISYITIDLSSYNNFDYVRAVQGDQKTRYIHITLLENQKPYVLSDIKAVLRGTKPDGKTIYNNCGISDDGEIIVELTEQILAFAGIGKYEIALYDTDESVITSFPFNIYVSPAQFNPETILSSDEFTELTTNISKIKTVTDNATQIVEEMTNLKVSVEELEKTCSDNEKDRTSSEKDRKSSEDTRKSNEKTRISNENIRINNEDQRKTLEEDRKSSEATRKENEALRVSNENDRKSNEDARKKSEATRNTDELKRVTAENERIKNENTRISNETERKESETIRKTSEEIRVSNENTRVENEKGRISDTTTAISNANLATDRANKAAQACENIVAGTGIVMQVEKGSKNGVAALDENAIIKREQLPPIELISTDEPTNQLVNDFWLIEY